MDTLNVMKTKELNLCLSCEICAAGCPLSAISMEYWNGQFLPKVEDEKCAKCGLCLKICPGIDIDPLELLYKNFDLNLLDGPCIESYTAYCNNQNIRKISTSGGLITALILELIKKKEFDAAFILPFNKFTGHPARLESTDIADEIISAAQSKYIPSSVYNVIKALQGKNGMKYISVATPCQIYGIKKFINENKINDKKIVFLGLFCDRTLNFNVIRYFENTYKKAQENLIRFEFRTKEKSGWPGISKMHFDSGREKFIDRDVRIKLKKFFQLHRCLFCLDKLNRFADISFGDCYIRGKSDSDGKSNVIIRTEIGKQIFDKYSYLFRLEKEDVNSIRESQGLIDKRNNLEYLKVLIREHDIFSNRISHYKHDVRTVKKLSRLRKYIRWGAEYKPNKIEIYLASKKIVNKLRETVKRALIGGSVILESFLIYVHKRKTVSREIPMKNVVIVGTGSNNKGAQAMLFTSVDQIRRKFPSANICLLNTEAFEISNEEKKLYKFEILPWNLDIIISLLGFWSKFFITNNKYESQIKNIENVLKNADCILDLSGYVLSSQVGGLASIKYMLNIVLAKKYSIRYYILPQSIGPFDYSLKHRAILYPLFKLYLKYPEKIFVREKEGMKHVKKFRKDNIEKSCDIVLHNRGYELAHIFTNNFHLKNMQIEPNSVGIIPNTRVFKVANDEEIYSIYYSLINRLINAQKTVYLLKYSIGDLKRCEKIKGFFQDNEKVKLIINDFNPIELENIIKQFEFVIASRYHSLVHAYRNGIPALVIGWASKYFELMENFNQLDYFFDVRSTTKIKEIENSLDKMVQNYTIEKEKIKDKINDINRENIFDFLDRNIEIGKKLH